MRYAVHAAGLAAVVFAGAAAADDRVRYRDPAKKGGIAQVSGQVTQDSVAGLTVKPTTGKAVEIPAADIVDVVYEVPAAVRINSLGKVLDADEKGPPEEAKKLNEGLLKDLGDEKFKAARRHTKYKIANYTALIAQQKNEDLPTAAEALEEFIKEYPTAWEAVPAGKQLGRVQAARGKFDEAAKVYERMLKTDGLPAAAKQDFELLAIDALIQSGKAADAQKRIADAIGTLKDDDPQKPRLEVYLIGSGSDPKKLADSVAKLTKVISGTNEPKLRALAYNTLGDCYAAAGQLDDAKFAYLMVDVVLNQDKTEHAKAVERLAKVFKDLKDEQRAEDYKAKLLKVR